MIFSTTSQIWSAQGTALTGTGADETNNVQEPNVIYETGAQILSGTVFKMWYTSGWASPQIHYAESSNGLSWTKYGSNPVLNAFKHSSVYKDGSTYKLYAVPAAVSTRIDYYTSSDGLSWSLDTASALTTGAGGAWDNAEMGNNVVWKEGAGDFRMIYEARQAAGAWHLGYATSADGKSWSKSGSNPVINETGSTGGPFIYKAVTNDYWMWVHRSDSGTLPTDLVKYRSTDLTTWTRTPANLVLTRRGSDEGCASANGQIADIALLNMGSQTYAWYGAYVNGTAATGHSTIKFSIARVPLSQLIYTNEGY